MKKFWICLLLVLLTGCGTPTEEVAFSGSVFTSAEEVYAVDLEETYPESLGKGGKAYRNLEALAGDADAVVLGCATSVKKNGSGLATEFVVQEYWQGSLWKGALITVREKGGIPPMEPDGTYLLFLQGEYPEYSLCGAVQGRFVERNGYLFQQTWKNRKIPETPARTENLENAVYRLQPHPADDLLGPPWTLNFENGDALKQFLTAAECPDACTHWLEENRMVHKGMLSEFEEASEIAVVLRKLPLPTLAADLPVDVYPDYDRDYVQIVHRNGEKTCRITIPMEAKTAEEGKYDRLVEAENFQVLFDRTDVLLETETYHHYVGQVNDCQVSFGLWGYEKEEALQFLKALQFETLP